MTQIDVDKILIQEAQNSKRHKEGKPIEGLFCRFEFMEILIRMALKKYFNMKTSGSVATIAGAIEKFIEVDFIPNVESADYAYAGYRYEKVQIEPVETVLKANDTKLKTLFDTYKTSGRDYITVPETINMFKRVKFDISETEIVHCFALSKMPTLNDLSPSSN